MHLFIMEISYQEMPRKKYIAIVGSMTTCFLRSVGNYVLEPLSIVRKCDSEGVEKNCIKKRES